MRLFLAAIALIAISACTTNYDRTNPDSSGYERPWDIQQRMERSHYG
jgi:hypothetical protein